MRSGCWASNASRYGWFNQRLCGAIPWIASLLSQFSQTEAGYCSSRGAQRVVYGRYEDDRAAAEMVGVRPGFGSAANDIITELAGLTISSAKRAEVANAEHRDAEEAVHARRNGDGAQPGIVEPGRVREHGRHLLGCDREDRGAGRPVTRFTATVSHRRRPARRRCAGAQRAEPAVSADGAASAEASCSAA